MERYKKRFYCRFIIISNIIAVNGTAEYAITSYVENFWDWILSFAKEENPPLSKKYVINL